MSRHEQIVVELSVCILRAAMGRAGDSKVDSLEVRLALRCLLHRCPDRWTLEMFWSSAGTAHDIGRAQGCAAAFNGIVRQLRLAGHYRDTS